MPSESIKGLICWDIDGVLIQHAIASGRDWREEFANPQALELYTSFEGHDPRWQACLKGELEILPTLRQKAKELGFMDDVVTHTLRVWHGRNTYWNHETLALMAYMKRSGWLTAIASNQDKSRATLLRQALWLEEIVDVWGFSCELGQTKAEEDFFKSLCMKAHAENLRCIMIDDVAANLVAPARLGWGTHLFTDNHKLKHFLEDLST